MAALPVVAAKSGISSGSAALKTLIQIVAPTNQRLRIKEVALGFHGTNNTAEPILVQLFYQSTAGAMSALTLVTQDPDLAETIQSTAQHTATVEPTAGNVIRYWTVHPQTPWAWAWLPSESPICKGGGRIALGVNNNGTAVNVDATIVFEE